MLERRTEQVAQHLRRRHRPDEEGGLLVEVEVPKFADTPDAKRERGEGGRSDPEPGGTGARPPQYRGSAHSWALWGGAYLMPSGDWRTHGSRSARYRRSGSASRPR